MDARQESDLKRWFTSGWAKAVAVGGVVTVIAGWITAGETIGNFFSSWFTARLHDIDIRDLSVAGGTTYQTNLYDLGERAQDLKRFWTKTLPPVETGYLARLEFVVVKKSVAPAKNCMVEADTTPMWTWLDPAPPKDGYGEWRLNGEYWYPAPFVGTDRLRIGDLPRGPDETPIKFEVFFREKKRSLSVRLICEGWVKRVTPWLSKEVGAPGKTNAPYIRVKLKKNPWYSVTPIDPKFGPVIN
jgi:hypothetical protein